MKKRNQLFLCVGIISFLILGFILLSTLCPVEEVCASEHQEPIVEAFDVNKTINVTVEVIDPMPVSEHIRKFNMTKMGRMYRAIDGPSYIDPDHEVVQWFARNTVLNETGLYYLNGKRLSPEYHSDFDCENGEYWLNADYYLSNGMCGDCEDFAIGIASILEAKGVPNIITITSNRRTSGHAYAEYYYEGEYYIADTRRPLYRPQKYEMNKTEFKVCMFNINNTYMTYNENWMDIL